MDQPLVSLFTLLRDSVLSAMPHSRRLLMRLQGARAAGAAIAQGSVLVFLDSHVEVLPFWLEPLLQRIRESPKTAALPRIASIDAETFEIHNGGIDTLAFNWSLGHMHRDEDIRARKINLNKSDTDPIESPIMPGGIFAIAKDWWDMLGGYDEGLRLYAGEEFELSFKVWMCGGSLEVLTCSKVAHVFRSDKYWKGQVYRVPGEEISRNKQRAAHVWMDEYVRYVLLTTPPVSDEFLGDLEPQKALRKKLGCNSFQWYLDNVYPELEAPSLETAKTGAIYRRDINACLDTMQRGTGPIGAFPCHFSHGTQAFLFDGSSGKLFVGQKGFNSCVGGDPTAHSVLQFDCNYDTEGLSMLWHYNEDTNQLQLVTDEAQASTEADPMCLRIFAFPTEESPHAVELAVCDPHDAGQHLVFVP
ncbi:UDP-N-acetyl-D-galactosamine:polypeptide N-acetylgalactosaminyltransferase [Cyclospora cayetanensis]|uniref:Protein-UDP acetylgalactosaminyltransferase 7 n=1 Tax=Cyclospora cayetanensis TaxID=88456 RepID=A0A1D3CV95_9EIME|nr:UDP-N-acetyl-D-galactosamine:polypeptide N-acetylgalactosaminyltransferase [Cyclospora cayetanensis]